MLKRLLVLLGFAALLGAGYAVAAGMTVTMTADGPQPARATVAWGDTVTFANSDDKVHQITIPRISLESPAISPGGAFAYVFNGRRGNYGYRQTGGGPNKLGTIVVELKGSVTLKASATIVRWGKSLRLTGKSTFPGTPVNIAERVPGSGTPGRRSDHRGGGGRLVRGRDQAAARRAVSRAGRRRPDCVRHGAGLDPADAHDPRAFAAREDRQSGDGHRARDAGASGDDAPPAAPRPAPRPLAHRPAQATRKRPGDVQVEGRQGRTRLRIAVRPLGLKAGWAEAVSAAVSVTGVK